MVTYGERKAPRGNAVEVLWNVPRVWEGETCFILGGGSSLRGFDAEVLRGCGRVIAIKDAGLYMAPWADVLYWSDFMWTEGDHTFPGRWDELGKFEGEYKITRARGLKKPAGHTIYALHNTVKVPLSRQTDTLAGPDSGSNAINLAFLFGARRIVLLGFDMRGPNWDGRKRFAEDGRTYATRFMPFLAKMGGQLAAERVEVLNASPSSRLTCFRMVNLEEVLPMAKRGRPRKTAPNDDPFASPEDYAGEDDSDLEEEGLEEGAPEPEESLSIGPGEYVAEEALAPPVEAPGALGGPVVEGMREHGGEQFNEVVGLDLLEPLEVRGAIRSLGARHRAVIVTVRTIPRPDMVTRRPSSWWRMLLETAFDRVEEIDREIGSAAFLCRKI